MRLLAVIVLAACAPKPPPVRPVECPPPVAAPEPAPTPAPKTLAALDDAQVATRATAFLKTMADRELAAFEAATAPAFVSFVYGRTYDRKNMIARFSNPQIKSAPRPERSCEHAQTRAGATSAIYTAECTDKYPAHEDMPAYTTVGLYSVVLVADGDWKVTYLSYQPAGVEMERELWNDTFQRGAGFNKEPNQHLVDSVKGRKPGKALDIAMGQGRNVLGLAALGWKVTGVDISDAGIKLAKEAAAKKKLTFEGVVQDIDKYELGTAKWDLVTLIYAGTDQKLIARIQPSIKKGGLFVAEYFHKDATTGIGIGGFADGELAAQFKTGWKILKDEAVEDIADWGLRKSKVVRFTAQKL